MPGEGIIGQSAPTDIPHVSVPQQDLAEERNKAKFSKTKEFQRIKEHVEERTKFYQTFLPNGTNVNNEKDLAGRDLTVEWKVANAVIGELNAIVQAYESAAEVVAKADGQ